jgi:hypothetical protein
MRDHTRHLMSIALAHAQAALAHLDCHGRGACCQAYEGSAWNGGTHVTVIVDRGLCETHRTRPAFADVEVWIYDIQGPSIDKLGKEGDLGTAGVLKTPGDADEPAPTRRAD